MEIDKEVAEIGPVPKRAANPPRPPGRAGRVSRGLKFGHHEPEPTQAHRNLVKAMVACGATQEIIAKLLNMSRRTLSRYFKAEIATGKAEVIAHLSATVVQKAFGGDNDMLKFFLRSQAGWKDNASGDFSSLPGTEHGAGIMPTLVIGFLENEDAATIDGEAEAA